MLALGTDEADVMIESVDVTQCPTPGALAGMSASAIRVRLGRLWRTRCVGDANRDPSAGPTCLGECDVD